MPFSHIPKNPGDLIKSDDWNKALNAVVDLFAKFNAAGHKHTGVGEDAPQIAEAGIANNAISNAKIQNGAVSNAKIQDGAVTLNKVAAGIFARDIGLTFVLTLSNGQSIPPPSGFTAGECIFFVAVTSASYSGGAFNASWNYTVKVNASGVVTVATGGTGSLNITVSGLALAKKGGW